MHDAVDCKVLVLRDDHRRGLSGVPANPIVAGRGETDVKHMLGIMAERLNSSGESRRELSVDEKAQSRASQNRMIVLLGGKLKNRGDVVGFEIGVVCEDLFPRGAGSKEIKHILHADAQTANTRAAATDVRTHRDSIDQAHGPILARLAASAAADGASQRNGSTPLLCRAPGEPPRGSHDASRKRRTGGNTAARVFIGVPAKLQTTRHHPELLQIVSASVGEALRRKAMTHIA